MNRSWIACMGPHLVLPACCTPRQLTTSADRLTVSADLRPHKLAWLSCRSYGDFLWALENVRSRAFSGPYTGSSGACAGAEWWCAGHCALGVVLPT